MEYSILMVHWHPVPVANELLTLCYADCTMNIGIIATVAASKLLKKCFHIDIVTVRS